jgi:hypothetical protein
VTTRSGDFTESRDAVLRPGWLSEPRERRQKRLRNLSSTPMPKAMSLGGKRLAKSGATDVGMRWNTHATGGSDMSRIVVVTVAASGIDDAIANPLHEGVANRYGGVDAPRWSEVSRGPVVVAEFPREHTKWLVSKP